MLNGKRKKRKKKEKENNNAKKELWKMGVGEVNMNCIIID
jgi:hypothetical protein